MSATGWVRQAHRWISIAFVALVLANMAAYALGAPPAWLTYAPLAPLLALMLSGLWLFALPYRRRR